ncbi:MAG: glycosyl transferase, partial [Dictyoglomaceae bacterium]
EDGRYIKVFDPEIPSERVRLGGSYCTQLNTMVINMMVCEDTDLVFRAIHYYPFVLIDDYHHYYYQGSDNLFNF